ncbi:MAG: DUF1538 family protein [Betaproteobacteria bacterium]
MKKTIRYGEYLGAVRARQHRIDYNKVVAADHEAARRRQQLRMKDVYRLLAPYVSVRFIEQCKSVVPLAVFLALFELVVLNGTLHGALPIALGVLAVIIGLMLFIEGIQHGLMSFSENIGFNLPSRSTLPVIAGVALVLGMAATFAEPAIAALRTAGSLTDPQRAPVLYSLLNHHGGALVAAIALSVGLAVTLGLLRMMMEWRLKMVIIIVLLPCLMLTAYLAAQPEYATVLGLAWDCGGITTGPVTVPLVVALGVGVAAAAGSEDNPLSGFGIVTLASLFPAMAVMLLALALPVENLQVVAAAQSALPWYAESPAADVLAALRAILPLALLLWLIQRILLKQPIANRGVILYGLGLCVVGMLLFNLGLAYGLAPLGNQAGGTLPAAFAEFRAVQGSPLYPYWSGLVIVVGFGAVLGFGATVAEPALNAFGMTVQNLTDGAFPRALLIRGVAVGVGLGTAAGVLKIVLDLPIANLLLPAYLVALVMTALSDEIYVNLAWDSAGVTTGPVTVPLVLAMGLGLGQSVHAVEGFGILALASVGPVLSVLSIGLWIRLSIASSHARRAEMETGR